MGVARWRTVRSLDDVPVSSRSNGLPRLIHFVWVGSEPSAEIQSRLDDWAQMNAACEVLLWRESGIECLVQKYSGEVDLARLLHAGVNHAVTSDVVRFAVLESFGGIYLDTDMDAVRPITSLFYQDAGFVVRESRWLLVAAAIGFNARATFPSLALKAMDKAVSAHGHLDNYMSGPPLVTELQKALASKGMTRPTVLPPSSFYPYNPFRFPRVSNGHVPPFGVHLFAHSWASGGEMSIKRRLVRLAQPITPKDIAVGSRRQIQLELRKVCSKLVTEPSFEEGCL